jgi:hypothetical protein
MRRVPLRARPFVPAFQIPTSSFSTKFAHCSRESNVVVTTMPWLAGASGILLVVLTYAAAIPGTIALGE